VAHSDRNKETGIMFTLCLGFIIFAGAMLALQGRSLADNLKVFIGADVVFLATRWEDRLREPEMRAFLEGELVRTQAGEAGHILDGYTFVTFPLEDIPGLRKARFSNLPDFPSIKPSVFGLEENYLTVTNYEFLNIAEMGDSPNRVPQTGSGDADVIATMYTSAGIAVLAEEADGIRVPDPVSTGYQLYDTRSVQRINNNYYPPRDLDGGYLDYIDCVASSALRDGLSVSTETPLTLAVENDQGFRRSYLAKARALLTKVPGFFFSSYRQTARGSAVLVRMDSYQTMLETAWSTLDDLDETVVGLKTPPKSKLMIRVTDTGNLKAREDLMNGIRVFFRSDSTVTIDTLTLIEDTSLAVEMMSLFFIVVGFIAMTLCFFILWLSFTANVQQNGWEFGVLRAVGLTSVEITMVYVYEALCIVFASFVLGSCIGLLIAASITLQFTLFTELPFVLEFPTELFLAMLSMALAVSVVGSVMPARNFLQRSIADVIKRT
jgi:hypothetical protein